jgi:hypothetical protein
MEAHQGVGRWVNAPRSGEDAATIDEADPRRGRTLQPPMKWIHAPPASSKEEEGRELMLTAGTPTASEPQPGTAVGAAGAEAVAEVARKKKGGSTCLPPGHRPRPNPSRERPCGRRVRKPSWRRPLMLRMCAMECAGPAPLTRICVGGAGEGGWRSYAKGLQPWCRCEEGRGGLGSHAGVREGERECERSARRERMRSWFAAAGES